MEINRVHACFVCQWKGQSSELISVGVITRYGDVIAYLCPECRAIVIVEA